MAKTPVIPATPYFQQSTVPYADSRYKTSARQLLDTPYFTDPDYTLIEDFSGVKDTVVFNKDAYTTWGLNNPQGGGKVLSGRYAPDGLQPDDSAWSEQELELPIDAVQVIVKLREFIPTSYTSDDTYNHKSIGFWSGAYGAAASNIFVSSECWPKTGDAYPSIYPANDGVNFGQFRLDPADELALWEESDGQWHEICGVVELATAPGEFGRYRLYRDGVVLADSNDTRWFVDYDLGIRARDALHYSTRGNFIDTVRLFGWCNPAPGNPPGTPAFSGTMHFLYSDLEVTANSTFKTIVEPT